MSNEDLPKVGFDVGGVLSPLENDVPDMQLSGGVVKLLSDVRVLTGAENMVLISKVGYNRRCRIEELISKCPLLSLCFPEERRFFSRCDKENPAGWKVRVCRGEGVSIMVDDSFHICRKLRAAGVRCFRPLGHCRRKDCEHHDNFLSPEDAVRAVIRELTEVRERLGLPTAPFTVFRATVPLPISKPCAAATVLPVAQVKQDQGAALLEQENPEDSLIGWRSLGEPVFAETNERFKRRRVVPLRMQENPEDAVVEAFPSPKPPFEETTEQPRSSCKGRHLHQPAVARRRLLSFREWQNECFEQAKIARCQRCVEQWREVLHNAQSKSKPDGSRHN